MTWMAVSEHATDFHRIEVEGQTVRLFYALPSDVVEIAGASVTKIDTYRRFRRGRGLLLITEDGRFTGAPGGRARRQAALLEQALERE